ncbi:MAG: alpha/beta fold hydrolase, partial [Alcanivorax sp.]|nr:alpha/beta fold hydrolase [Alcanivorax sp.]
MTEIREQKVQANGLNFHVRSAGDPAHPAVILLHGFPECGYSWRYQMPFLADKGFHVLAPDLRGYGFSDAPKDADAYRQDKLVADVMGILDAFGAERAVVVDREIRRGARAGGIRRRRRAEYSQVR